MTEPTDPAAQAARLFSVLVPDPDPQREKVACPDCSTPQLVVVPAPAGGAMLVIAHDPGCPSYAGMSDDQRQVITDEGTLVHVSRPERKDQ